MTWDQQKRVYRDDSGRIIPAAQIRKYIDEYIAKEQREIERESNRLFVGAITLAAFFDFLRQKLTNWHSVTGVIAYGGQSQMTPERWKRVNEKVISELKFLKQFEQQAIASFTVAESIAAEAVAHLGSKIPAGLEAVVQERVREALLTAAPSEVEAIVQKTIVEALADSLGAQEAASLAETAVVDKGAAILDQLIGGTIPSRAQLYPESSYATYENNVRAREGDLGATLGKWVCAEDDVSCEGCLSAATDDYIPLEELPEIGSHECISNCRCSYVFSYHGMEPLTVDRKLTTENILTA